MKIRTPVLVSLLVATAAGLLAYRFAPPLPLSRSPDPEFINALLLGRFCSAVLIAGTVYATVISAMIGVAIIGEVVALRRRLEPLEAAPDQRVKRGDWEAAFSRSSFEPLCYRLISAKFPTPDDNLLLADPFSPSLARKELRGFYPRHLGIAQVLTVALLLPGTIGAAMLMTASTETALFLTRVIGIAECLLLACIGFGFLGISIVVDKLISSIARLPLVLDGESRPLSTRPESDGTTLERLSTSIAAAIRTEMHAVVTRLEKRGAQNAVAERNVLERLTETLAATDKTLTRSLHSSEENGATLERLSTSVAAAIRTEMQVVFTRLETLVAQNVDNEQRLLGRLSETLAATNNTLMRSLHSSEENGAVLEQLPTSVAAAIRAEMQVVFTRLETLVAQNVDSEQRLVERLSETLAAADKTLVKSLQSSEENGAVLDLIRTEVANAVGTLPASLAQQFSSQCEAILECSREAMSSERDAIQEGIANLGNIFSQSAERQFQEVGRLASEHDQAIQYLGDTIRQAYVEGERDKHAAFAKATDLMQSVEAYAASLLPAVKRLEGCEERVAAAVAYESETLSRLSVYVKELSGTLDALRVALAHGRNEIAPVLVQTQPDTFVPIAQDRRADRETDFSKLASQLYTLLDELEEKAPSD